MRKKVIFIIGLLMTMLIILTAVPTLAAFTLKGDVNLDGIITSIDLTMMKEYINESRGLSGQGLRNADMNGDGEVTSTDVAMLNRLLNCSHANHRLILSYSDCVGAYDNGDNTHIALYVTVNSYRCNDCGKEWEERGNDQRTIVETHNPTRYGRCDQCGVYVLPYYPVSPTATPSSGGTGPMGNHQLVPDSSTRRMTESECWNWTYEAMGFVFHEILARHGFIFDPNGNYAWYFTAQAWYHSISTRNNEDVYARLNSTEWYNIDLIKSVRQKMRNQGTTNPNGRQAPQHTLYYQGPGGYSDPRYLRHLPDGLSE